MAEALTAIHAAGVVHRDLKPGNVMLTDDRPIVIDFGIAQTGDATRLTQTGLVMGTPGYLAPEVIEGEPSSPASDVHSWGSTMAFAATGHLPFGGGSYETIFYRIVSGRADLTGVPAPLVPLISAALARDPSHRPVGQLAQRPGRRARHVRRDRGRHLQRRSGHRDPVSARGRGHPRGPPGRPAAGPLARWARHGSRRRLRPSRRPGTSPTCCPPVNYPPAGRRTAAAPRTRPARGAPQGPKPAAGACRPRAAASRPAPGRTPPPDSPSWSPLVALTVVLPVAGLLVSLAVITLLRAADRAQSKLAVRRSVRGPRASDLVVVLVTAPLTVARALLTEALMAPLAAIVGAAAYGLTVVVTHSTNMPRAGAYAAAAVVAWYGLGPGSGRPRRQLNRMAGAVARTRTSAAAITLSVWALAVAAVLFASSQTPYYWPAVAPHLPSLHHLIVSASHWLLRNTHL